MIMMIIVSHPDDLDDNNNYDDYDDIEDDHDFDDDHDQVERIEGDSGDTYGCQPSPGPAAEVKVHVIREGGSLMRMNYNYDDEEDEVKIYVIREGGSLMGMMGMRRNYNDDEL